MVSFLSKNKLKAPEEKAQKKSNLLKWIGRFFMGIGITVFVSISVMIICVSSLMGDHQVTKPLPEKFALGYYFKESMPDFINRTSFVAQLFPDSATSIYDFIRALEDAKTDERVTMFVAKLKDGDYSLTQIETLRNAIIDFRSSGKKAYVYADSIGGFSNGCDDIVGDYFSSVVKTLLICFAACKSNSSIFD